MFSRDPTGIASAPFAITHPRLAATRQGSALQALFAYCNAGLRRTPNRLAPLFICMTIVLSSSTLTDAATGGRIKGNPRPPNHPANRSTRKPHRPARKGHPEYELYVLDQHAYRTLETEEMLTIARHMYQLNAAESTTVTTEIQRIQRERWDNNKTIGELAELISKRAAFFQTVRNNDARSLTTEMKYKQLQRNPDFVKVMAAIRRYDRRHPHRFTDCMQQLERVLDPAKVDEAHRLWNKRASTIRSSIQIKELFRGMFSKIRNTKPRAKPKSTPRNNDRRSQTPNRTGKPRSNVTGRQPPSAPRRTASSRAPRRTPKHVAAIPLNDWEKYVRNFIRTYDLSPTQTNAALSILKDLTSRAVQIERANEQRIAEANMITDAKLKRDRLTELNQPINSIFVELQSRLEQLLTADQLNRVKQTPPRSPRKSR